MLIKLAFKNASKSIKDYLIYFFTLTFGVCIFYMFNSIHAQQAMMNLTEEQTDSVVAITRLLNYVSAFVIVLLGFLIVYANNFFIKRRTKELGIYMTLGMEKRSISLILVLETLIMALLALALGIILGIFGSQFMSVFTAKLFEADLKKYSFIFSMASLLKSIAYFGCIFIIVIIFNVFVLGKYKLIDLLYDICKNEEQQVKNPKISVLLFLISIAIIALSYYLILSNGMFNINFKFFSGIACGVIGTLFFFYSLSGILVIVVENNKKIYYKNLNMFVLRQLASKINTNFISISIVCITLLLTIGIFSTGYSMKGAISEGMKKYAGYDYTFFNYIDEDNPKDDINNLINFLNNNKNVSKYEKNDIYYLESKYSDFGVPLEGDVSLVANSNIYCMSVSDYNKSAKLQGKKELKLNDEEYALLTNYKSMADLADKILKNSSVLKINDKNLLPKYSLKFSIRNGMEQIMMIIPDKYINDLPESTESIVNVNCIDGGVEAFKEDIKGYENNKNKGFDYCTSKSELYADAITQKSLLSFISIYLGIVFMITCAAVLAIQQLTEASDNKYRYELLAKLGAEKKMLNKALFIQILCYFIFPLALAIVHAIFGLKGASETLKTYGNLNLGISVVITAIFVGTLYIFYFLITYLGSKNVIMKGR